MLDIGWTELLLIGVVALIVVGPRDLPGMFRTLGRVTGRLRSMAREFQRAMDQAADESGLKDAAADMKFATSPKSLGLDQLKNSARDFQQSLRDEYQAQGDKGLTPKPQETTKSGDLSSDPSVELKSTEDDSESPTSSAKSDDKDAQK